MPRPVAKWNREVVCYFISFLHQPQNCPVAPPASCSSYSSWVEDERLRDYFHTQMIGLNMYFFVPASSKYSANLSPLTAVIQHVPRPDWRRRFVRKHRPGNGHTVGVPVAPRRCAQFDSAAQVGERISPLFSSRATSAEGHNGTVMQAVECLCLCDLTSVNGQRGCLGVEVAPCVLPCCESRKKTSCQGQRGAVCEAENSCLCVFVTNRVGIFHFRVKMKMFQPCNVVSRK